MWNKITLTVYIITWVKAWYKKFNLNKTNKRAGTKRNLKICLNYEKYTKPTRKLTRNTE